MTQHVYLPLHRLITNKFILFVLLICIYFKPTTSQSLSTNNSNIEYDESMDLTFIMRKFKNKLVTKLNEKLNILKSDSTFYSDKLNEQVITNMDKVLSNISGSDKLEIEEIDLKDLLLNVKFLKEINEDKKSNIKKVMQTLENILMVYKVNHSIDNLSGILNYLNNGIANDNVENCEESCRGCCINNECVSDGECKFLFWSSTAVLILMVVFGVCCGLGSFFGIIYYLIKQAKERKRVHKGEYSNVKVEFEKSSVDDIDIIQDVPIETNTT